MSEPTIAELRQAKEALAAEILAAIQRFQGRFVDVSVDYVALRHVETYGQGAKRVTAVGVGVEVEV